MMNVKGILQILDPRSRNQLKKYKYLFLLSHMRGYTTLLSHILGNHPDIAGYTENHQSYNSNFGFKQLEIKLSLLLGTAELPEYLCDKVLHNEYKIAPRYLHHKNVYSIMMIRKPENTIRSIINMGQSYTVTSRWYQDPDKVTEYYIKRLQKLIEYKRKSPKNYCFIRAESLLEDTDHTLQKLTSFLDLKESLSEEYDTFSFTGTNMLGDPSENIKKGKVIKDPSDYSEIEIPATLLKRATEAYDLSILELER